jgi:hypothetical protein
VRTLRYVSVITLIFNIFNKPTYRMRKFIFFSILISQLFSLQGYAQFNDPLLLTKRIFSRDTFPEIKKYSTHEYEGHPNGRDFREGLKVSFTLLGKGLKETDSTAVVNITLSDGHGNGADLYLHLKKDTIWKAAAFRALAMTGIIERVYYDLAQLTSRQVDSIIASPHTVKKDKRMFKTRAEYNFELGNTKLVLSSDSQLISHFNKNKLKFEALKNEFMKTAPAGTKSMKDVRVKNQMKALFIDNVRQDMEYTHGCLNFLIGGILDNAVGYMYIKDKKDVPEMSSGHFIMIREIGNGWYLYKTT